MATLDTVDKALLHYLTAYIRQHQHPPTVRDMTRTLGLVSSGATATRLRRLQDLGFIRQHPGQPHTLRVLKEVNP